MLIFVVKEQRLDGGDHDLSVSPVVAIIFVDDSFVIVGEYLFESFPGLILQFQAIHEEEHALRITGAQEEFDNSGSGERLARAGSHLKEKAIFAVFNGSLQSIYGFLLIIPKETQAVGGDEAVTLCLVLPCSLGRIAGALRKCNVIVANRFFDQALGVGCGFLITHHRCG